MSNRPVALVTGANKGIGYHVAADLFEKGYSVVLGCRDVGKARDAMMAIADKYADVEMGKNHKLSIIKLDLSDPASVPAAVAEFKQYQHRLDVLVNNAGVHTDDRAACLAVNYYGTIAVTEAFLPLLVAPKAGVEQKKARVVTVSSRLGQTRNAGLSGAALALLGPEGPSPAPTREALDELAASYVAEAKDNSTPSAVGFRDAYSASKALLSAYCRSLATRVEAEALPVTVSVTCPGFTKTDLTNNKGFKSAAQGAETIVWAAADESIEGVSGRFYGDDKKEIGFH